MTRQPDPTDGRGVLVQLTAEGLARVDAALSDLLTREQSILGTLTLEERVALADLLRTLIAPFDQAD